LGRIIADINSKLPREGYCTIDLDNFVSQGRRHHIEHPKMEITASFDVTSFQRAFVKIALGLSHYVMEEQYTRGLDADLLRQFLWEDDSRRREKIPLRGSVWPACEAGRERVLAFRDWHLLAILNTGPLSFVGILFGKYCGNVKLSETLDTRTMASGNGAVFLINPTDRSVRRFGFREYIAKHQANAIS
jgi:hypothetical protein